MSWRQYGGTNKTFISTVNAGSIVANHFLSRNTSANINQFDNLKIKGQLLSQDFIETGTYIKAFGQVITSGDLFVNNKAFFGTDASSVNLPWSYIFGNSYGISVNNKKPEAVFHITGLSFEVLKIDTSMNHIRNIIGQNVNARGVVVAADDSSSNIYFFNDVSTNILNTADSYIKNQPGTGLTIGSSSASVISLDNRGNILINAAGTLTLNSATGNFNISSSSTTLESYLIVTNRGTNYNGKYNESAIIYDSSNVNYLRNVYDVSSALTGNSLSLLAIDNSSNTFLRIIDPSGSGFSIGGGAFPADTSRSFGSMFLSDFSGNYILSQNIVSGNHFYKYASTTGINTYIPKTENYVLDINGPTRIGNGELKTLFNANFEFKQINFSKVDPNFGMAVGTASSPGTIVGSLIIYPQYFSYTRDKGKTWNTLPININLDNFSERSDNTFNSLFVYDTNFAIAGSNNNSLYWTNNGGLSWTNLSYNTGENNSLLFRNTTSIYVTKYLDIYRVFLSFEYTNNTNNTDNTPKYNTIYFNINPYDPNDNIVYSKYISYDTKDATYNIQNYFDYKINIITNDIIYLSVGPNNYSYKVNANDSNGQYIYFVGDGIIKVDALNSTPTTIYKRQNNYLSQYNGVHVYDDSNVIAVGNNILSWTNDGTNWTDIVLSTTSVGNVNLQSVYIYDLYKAVAVGNNGVFIYTTNWQSNNWEIVPHTLLNSSGIGSRIDGYNNQLRNIYMHSIDLFLISNVTTSYVPNRYNDITITQRGSYGASRLLYAYFPNIYNRINNTVLELSGNMVMSGDLNINDGGKLMSNNNTFYLLNSTVKNIYIGSNATINNMAGSLFVGNDLSLNSRLFIGGDVSMNKRLFVGGDVSMNGNMYIGGNSIQQGNVSMNSNLLVSGDVLLNSQLFVNKDVSMNSRLFIGSDVSMNGNMYTSGITILKGDVSMNSKLVVSGDVSMNNGLFVNNDVSMNSKLSVGSESYIGGNLSVQKDVLILGRLNVLQYAQSSIIYTNVTTNNYTLIISEDMSLNGRLVVNYDAFMNSRLFAGGDVSMNSNMYTGGISIQQGDVSMNSRLFVNGDVSMNSRLFISSDVSMNARLFVGSDASFIGNMYTGGISIQHGDVSMNSRLFVNGDVSMNSRLFISSDVSMNARLFVSRDVSLNGNLYTYGHTIIQGDLSLNSRLFLFGDASMNRNLAVTGNITAYNTVYSTYFDTCANLFTSNPNGTGGLGYLNQIFIGNNASTINIGTSQGYMSNRNIIIGAANSTNSTTANKIYIGGPTDTLIISGNLSAQNFNLTTIAIPAFIFNSTQKGQYGPGSATGSNYGTSFSTINSPNISSVTDISNNVGYMGAGFAVQDASLATAGFFTVNCGGDGFLMKGPTSSNIVDFYLEGLKYDQKTNFGNQSEIHNGIMVLTTDRKITSAAGNPIVTYSVSVKPIDISNIFLRDDLVTDPSFQRILTSVAVVGDVSMNSRLFVYNDVSFGGNMYAGGRTILQGDVSMNARLFINGDVSMNSRLFVMNDVSLNARLFVSGDASYNGNLYTLGRTINQGDVSMNSRLFISGDVSMNSRLFVMSDVSMNARLFVSGDASYNGNLYTLGRTIKEGDVSMNSRLFISGDVSMNSRLFVMSDVSMNARLFVSSDVSMNGNIYTLGCTILQGDVSMNSRLFINGDVSMNSRLFVMSDVSLNARLFVSGDASYNGNLYTLGRTINQGDVSMNSRLFVNGDVSMNSRLFVMSDVSMNARLFVSGDSSFNGNLYTLGSTINQGDVSMNSLLFISGDVSMNSNLFVKGDLSLNMRLFVGNDVVISGRLNVYEYTNNSVIYTNVTTSNYTLIIAEDLSLNGRLNLTYDASMNARLFVANDVSFGNNLYTVGRSILQGDVSMNSRLFISGDVSMNSRLFVTSDVSMGSRLFVNSDVSFGGNMYVSERTILQGDVSMNSRLFINGDVSMNSRLFVSSDVSMGARLFVNSDASFGGTIYIGGRTILQGDVSMNSRLFISGDVSMNARIFVGGDASYGGNMYLGGRTILQGDVSMNSRLFISGDVSMNSRLFVSSDILVGGRLFIGGDVSMNSRLFVASDVSMGGRLFVANDASFGGNMYVANNLFVGVSGNPYSVDMSGLINLHGTVNPISLVDNSVLLTNNPPLDFSNNYGSTWTPIYGIPGETLNSIAMSSNGQYQTVVTTGTGNLGNIYTSANYGFTWTINSSVTTKYWTQIAMSANGQYQTATVYGGNIWINTNYGRGNWTDTGGNYNTLPIDPYSQSTVLSTQYWVSVAMSANGQYQTAITNAKINNVYSGDLYRSTNYGNSWSLMSSITGGTQIGPNGLQGNDAYSGIAISSTGQYQVTCVYKKYIFLSNNFGKTWSKMGQDPPFNTGYQWFGISISSSGQYITAVTSTINLQTDSGYTFMSTSNRGRIYTSTNYGSTWNMYASDNSNNYWNGINMSANGQYQTAIVNNTKVDLGANFNVTLGSNIVNTLNTSSDYNAIVLGATVTAPGIIPDGTIVTSNKFLNTNGSYSFNISNNAIGTYNSASLAFQSGAIYSSNNYGAYWYDSTIKNSNGISNTVSQLWQAVAISANGQYQTALVAGTGGYIYSSITPYQQMLISNNLTVMSGDTTIYTRLFVVNDVSMTSRLFVSSDVSMNARLFVGGDASMNGNLYTLGRTILQGDVSMNSRLFVRSDVSMNARLFVGGDASMNGNLYTLGRTILQGDVSMNSRLFVNSNVSMNSNIDVNGTLTANLIKLNDGSIVMTKTTPDYLQFITTIFSQATFDANRSWYSVAMSSNGQYQTAVVNGGYIYRSNDYGVTWSQVSSYDYSIVNYPIGWLSVAMSANGQYQSVGGDNTYIYISNDYGVTWTQGTSFVCRSIAMSSNGQYQTAVTSSYIYRSIDFGVTWNQATSGSVQNLYSVAMSSDGKYQTTVEYGNYIYRSTDFGVTWTQVGSSQYWYSIAMSSNGQYQFAVVDSGYIYKSGNYGVTWSSVSTNGSQVWRSIATSSDGKYIFAVTNTGVIVNSTDTGVTWSQTNYGKSWYSIVISADSTYQTALESNGYIYCSRPPITNVIKEGMNLFVSNKSSFGGDVSMNARLFVGGDASLNARLYVKNDTKIDGNIYLLSSSHVYVGDKEIGASTATETNDTWTLTNLIRAPPAPDITNTNRLATTITFAWTYPTQILTGFSASPLPLISYLNIQLTYVNGSGTIGPLSILSKQTGPNYINTSYGSTTAITAFVITNSNSITRGYNNISVSGSTRYAYTYYNDNLSSLVDSPSNNLTVWYDNYNTLSPIKTSITFSNFLTAGTPGQVTIYSIASVNTASPSTGNPIIVTFQYYPPTYSDSSTATLTLTSTNAPIKDYKIDYLITEGSSARYPNAVTTLGTATIGATSASTSLADTTTFNYFYPECTYYFSIVASNKIASGYGTSAATTTITTTYLNPRIPSNSITFPTTSYQKAKATLVSNTSSSPENVYFGTGTLSNWISNAFYSPINSYTTRGKNGTDTNASLIIHAALGTNSGSVTYKGFPSSTPTNFESTGLNITTSTPTDSYSTSVNSNYTAGHQGFYLETSNTITINAAALIPSSSPYTLRITQTQAGATFGGAATTTIFPTIEFPYYFDTTASLSVESFTTAINSNTTYIQICGIYIIYGTVYLTATTSVNNLGNYFFNSNRILEYSGTYVTTSNESGITNIADTYKTAYGALTTRVTVDNIGQAISYTNSSYATQINSITVTACNPVDSKANGTSTAINAILDQPSYNLYSSFKTSIGNTALSTTSSYGMRVYSGVPLISSYAPNYLYSIGTPNVTYIETPFSNSWNLTESSISINNKTYNGQQELLIAGGKFRTRDSTYAKSYSTFYYTASLINNVNYESLRIETVYRYVTFAWKISITSNCSSLNIVLNDTEGLSVNSGIIYAGSTTKIILYHRLEDSASLILPTSETAGYMGTWWISANNIGNDDGTLTYGQHTAALAYIKPVNNLPFRPAGSLNNTQNSSNITSTIALPVGLSSSNTGTLYSYIRVGLPMSVQCSIGNIQAFLS